jgi:hypothetical protein
MIPHDDSTRRIRMAPNNSNSRRKRVHRTQANTPLRALSSAFGNPPTRNSLQPLYRRREELATMRKCTASLQVPRSMVQPARQLLSPCNMRPICKLQRYRDSRSRLSTNHTAARAFCGRSRTIRRHNRRTIKSHGTPSVPELRLRHSPNTEFRRLNTTSRAILCRRVRPRQISQRRIYRPNIKRPPTHLPALQRLKRTPAP